MASSEKIFDELNIQLLNAMELFHYASKFRDSRFVIVLSESSQIIHLIDDFRVLLSSQISFCIVCHSKSGLRETIEQMHHRGLELEHHSLSYQGEILSKDVLVEMFSPKVFALDISDEKLLQAGIDLARHWKASRVVFLSENNGIEVNNRVKSHLSCTELQGVIEAASQCSFPKDMLSLMLRSCLNENLEFSVLRSERGQLFQELFTHIGTGTLISATHESKVRQATELDVLNIFRLLRPEVGSGSILQIDEDYVASHISSFYVYTVNGAIVAAAMLKAYGEDCELAKFCTLPRYQGKGKARVLAEKLIIESKKQHKRSVFSLSTSEAMWHLFESLGMKEVERDSLPESWKQQYDLSRPSKAFSILL